MLQNNVHMQTDELCKDSIMSGRIRVERLLAMVKYLTFIVGLKKDAGGCRSE